MKYDPEDLLSRSGLDAPGAAAFLLENYTDFIDEGAIDDAAAAAAYLSDAGEGRACGALPFPHVACKFQPSPHLVACA